MIGCPSNRPPPEDKIPVQRTSDEIEEGEAHARAAKDSAKSELDEVESRWPEIRQRTAFLRVQRQENHFAERIRLAFIKGIETP